MQNRAQLEVATTTAKPSPRFSGVQTDRTDPPRRCITDRSRSRHSLYIRLETWLARLLWDAVRDDRGLEAELLAAELHYVREHLRKKRRGPCAQCRLEVLERFERIAREGALQVLREVKEWASTGIDNRQ